MEFTATGDDANARVHLDLGASLSPLEVSPVSLRELPSGQPMQPTLMPVSPSVASSEGNPRDNRSL